jgi:GAF domain-containing protein
MLRESSTAVTASQPALPPPSRDPTAAFADLSKIVFAAQPLSQSLARVAELAKETIPGAMDVSVTLVQDGRVSTVAFTGSLAAQFDERQYEAGFGPCMDAALSGTIITIEDTSSSETYTDFGRVAQRHGITHTMSIGLPGTQQTVGALNTYGAGQEGFDEATKELAKAFAGYAAVAVANAGVYASTVALVGNLQRALESRGVIDQAKGILMGQHGVSADAAFELLAQHSQRTNRKLREIAQEMVDRVQRRD